MKNLLSLITNNLTIEGKSMEHGLPLAFVGVGILFAMCFLVTKIQERKERKDQSKVHV